MGSKVYFTFIVFLIFAGLVQARPSQNTLTQNPKYQITLQNFLKLNTPLVQAEGFELKFVIDQESPNYFGGASLNDKVFSVSMGDRIPNQKKMTAEAFAFVLCHELGHLLGGSPKKINSDGSEKWSSAEGQADYYAAQVCLPKMFYAGDGPVLNNVIQAGLDMLSVIYEMVKFSKIQAPDLNRAETQNASVTQLEYPTLQCRLDTIVSGAQNKNRPPCWFVQ